MNSAGAAAGAAERLRPPSGVSALVSLRGVQVCFGEHHSLRAIDLEIQAGEAIALVGPNGSGKTTLLRVLGGVQPIAAGTASLPPVDAKTLVFQHPFLLHLSAQRNVELGLWLQQRRRRSGALPGPERRERALHALQALDLQSLANRRATALSIGQQQRLAIARAHALATPVVLLDEPTASLDPLSKRRVEQLLTQWREAGRTLVFATHNLGQAKRMASRVICLIDGRIQADRPTPEFFGADLPPAAAHFVHDQLPQP